MSSPQTQSYITLIKICIFLLLLGGCVYYFESQPDCIKMTVDGSLRCRCFFNSSDQWEKFKEDTKGLNGDGWESVAVDEDPCKTQSYLNLKKTLSDDSINNKNNGTVRPIAAADTHLTNANLLVATADSVKTENAAVNNDSSTSKVMVENKEPKPHPVTTGNNAIIDSASTAQDYSNKGYESVKLNDYQTAIKYFNRAIELAPNYATNYEERAFARERLRDYRGAITDYNTLIGHNPSNAYYYNRRGNEKYYLQEYNEALIDYDKAIELNPKDGTVYFNRANTKYQTGDKGGACSDWSKCHELGDSKADDAIKKFCNAN